MFYIYMIISVIISLVFIGIACVIPLFLLKEFDKMTYVKGYRKNLKWYKLPILLLLKISMFSGLIVYMAFIYEAIYIPESNLDNIILLSYVTIVAVSRYLGIRNFRMVDKIFIATPILGMGLTYIIIRGINELLYYFEMTIIMNVFEVICLTLPYVLISYYVVIIFRQFIYLHNVEKQQLIEQYNEFWTNDKKNTIKKVLLSDSAKKYKKEYLQLYSTEQKWKNSEINHMTYNLFSLQLFKLYSLVTIINCILFFIGGNIYDSGNYTFLQARLSMRACVIITGSLITIFCLNWLFNQEIILSFKNKQKLTAQSFTMFILSVVIGVMGIVLLITSMLDNSYRYVSGYEYNYEEFKSGFVNQVEVNRDYLSYNDYEKVDYIFRYPHHFVDDAEALNYKYDFFDGSFFVIVPVENSELIDSANKYYGEELNYSILITEFIRTYATLDVVTNLDDNRKNKMVLDQYDVFSVNINEANRQDHDYEFKTEEEVELGLLVKEEALKVINSLWDEEMKDRGLI
ncbi:hypothetical protein RZE82_06490 [Mollicutes bacterium LVI A0039]|nr:hypothetical protein RZE82_06490 [Mollicutes bacterium LVI A0039]